MIASIRKVDIASIREETNSKYWVSQMYLLNLVTFSFRLQNISQKKITEEITKFNKYSDTNTLYRFINENDIQVNDK